MKKTILLLAILTMFLIGCQNGPEDPSFENILDKDKIVIGTSGSFPPMSYMEGEEVIGHDVDFGKAIAEELGLDVEFVSYDFADIFPALHAGEVDIIIASITITVQRAELMAFSIPYFQSGQTILVREEDDSIKVPQDLKDKQIGIAKPADMQEKKIITTNEAQALIYTSEDNLRYYDDILDIVNAIEQGEIDATIMDYPSTAYYSKKSGNLKIAGNRFTEESYGIVMRKGEIALKENLDEIITKFKNDGTLEALEEKWLK